MISMKTIRISFSPNPNSFPVHNRNGLPKLNYSLPLCHSKSPDDSPDPPPEGDARKQEILFRMAMLQSEKVRLADYLDERSDYLTKFAEEASTEIDKIGEEALKELEVASNSLLEGLDSRMQALEEAADLNKADIEENERRLLEFEDRINKEKNAGLFFQGMEKKAAVTKKIEEVAKSSPGSKTRRNVYLALIGLFAVAIAETFLSSPPDWKKVAVLGAILVGLITQLSYEQGVSSETTDTSRKDGGKSDDQNK